MFEEKYFNYEEKYFSRKSTKNFDRFYIVEMVIENYMLVGKFILDYL